MNRKVCKCLLIIAFVCILFNVFCINNVYANNVAMSDTMSQEKEALENNGVRRCSRWTSWNIITFA